MASRFVALNLIRFDTIAGGELLKFPYRLMVGHSTGVPLALLGLISQVV
jgi:hypothetical protein